MSFYIPISYEVVCLLFFIRDRCSVSFLKGGHIMTKHNFKLVLLSTKEEVQNLELKTEDIKLISNIISVFNDSKVDIGDNLKETLIAVPPDNLVLTVCAILALLALIVICVTVSFMYYQHTHNKSSPPMKEKEKYDTNRKNDAQNRKKHR